MFIMFFIFSLAKLLIFIYFCSSFLYCSFQTRNLVLGLLYKLSKLGIHAPSLFSQYCVQYDTLFHLCTSLAPYYSIITTFLFGQVICISLYLDKSFTAPPYLDRKSYAIYMVLYWLVLFLFGQRALTPIPTT